MDLRTYYQKIRDTEAGIPTQFAVVISKTTDNGGKSGLPVEVTREVAAKMMVEGSAALATPEQTATFHAKQAAANKAAKEAAVGEKLSVTVVSSDDLKKLTDDLTKLRGKSRPAEG
jgi:hypothetical protein